ncbi:MAG: carboxypeptidase-like regulatory domain-containing protein [Candidatus Caldarchaeum sp.]|nr:carboxypeptidase-like regulatory domain-containing protein [Candidatus Caldarchaeum sp.]
MFRVLGVLFVFSLVFVYGDGAASVDPYYVLSPASPALERFEGFTVVGKGFVLNASRLVPGTYEVTAFWPDLDGVVVGTLTLAVNDGNVAASMVLALRDVSVKVVGLHGRSLEGAVISVNPYLLREGDYQTSPDGTTSFLRMPDGVTYEFKASWTSIFGKTAETTVRDTAAGIQRRGNIVLPVDDAVITVLDVLGRPVAGAEVFVEGISLGVTDSEGRVLAASLPLENEYRLAVTKDRSVVGEERVRFAVSKPATTIVVGIYDVTVFVRGSAGQPIAGAVVELYKDGVLVATSTTDPSGKAVFPKTIGADYTVRASYGGYTTSTSLPKGVRTAILQLDIFTMLLGVPLSFPTTVAIVAGTVFAVVLVAVAVSELVRWRGRRIGIHKIEK